MRYFTGTDDMARQTRDRLLAARRLCLAIDLDETLVHANPVPEPGDAVAEPEQFFAVYWTERHRVALRPQVREFLAELAPMYEMCVSTQAQVDYARCVIAELDPTGELFGDRVCARVLADSPVTYKSLIPDMGGPSVALAVDDRLDAWEAGCTVLTVRPFRAFPNPPLPPTPGPDRALSCVAERLRAVYAEFYRRADLGEDPSVSVVVARLRQRALAGITIAFAGVLEPGEVLLGHRYVQCARELGAECVQDVTLGVTHLVVADGNPQRFPGITAVNLDWLHTAAETWSWPDEADFPPRPMQS
ncbi:MAG: hypothetical protein M0R22_06325 [Dehalococcoidia bacterium]|jgi:RNA polymerase II subunit A-like phosphatase|nr:hypothetical protein [Dehalococcoidia bacterium]